MPGTAKSRDTARSTTAPQVRGNRPFTVEALWEMKRIGTPTLSPDGSTACAAVTRFDMEKNESATELWLFPTRAQDGELPRRLTAGDKDSEPQWSPDGRAIAFIAKRTGDEESQVYVIAPDGGEARRLTKLATGCASLKWFPDGKRLAFVSAVWPDLATGAAQAKRKQQTTQSKVKVHATERPEYRYWDHWLTDGREPHIMVCEVETGRCRDVLAGTGLSLPPWEPHAEDYDIAPDGREIALTVDRAAEPRMMNPSDIVTLDLRSRRVVVLTQGSGLSDAQPIYAPDGSALVWRSFDTARAFNDQGHLTHFDRERRRKTRLAPAHDRASARVQWTPDSRSLLFLSEDRGRQGLWQLQVDAGRGALPVLLVHGGTLGGFAQGGGVLAFDRATAMHPPALFACSADGTDERRIEALNAALLARHAFGEVREFTIKGHGGDPVQMFVAYPPGFDPGKKWPLLHSIHGGPHAAHLDSWHFRWNVHVFAAQGYVVAAVNYHGSSGFGQRWLESITGKYGLKEFADTEAATDHLLRQGYIDRTRLLASGGSYGGYMVAYMNGHTDRYRAYVCHAGCYDWVSMMATDGYHFFAKELGAFHWDNPSRVMRQSPHHYVKRARTPTLVIHGEQDFRVPATQALQYYDTLKAKGVAARLLWFTDENHWILKPQNSRLWYREFLSWLERFGGAKTPAKAPAARVPRRRASGA
ncbi:MAG: S9 family peptidase [Pseudomonadota bacterium]|nr:S9 family peptidase [Pseudomonadota bacterium]